jgi:hypothetical protein
MATKHAAQKAVPKELTVEEFRKRLADGKSKELHFVKVRSAWRAIVKKRALQLKHAIERRKAKSKPHVVGGNRVVGGTAPQRLVFAMEYAHKVFRLEYSEAGTWVEGYGLTNVPGGHGFRTDCSWWVTMIRYACGLEGPSIIGGYTGTILTEGKEVTRHYAETHPGVCVVFGSGAGFHTALSLGNGTSTTYGHGVPEVDISTFDAFGSGTEVRYRAFPNTPIKEG